MSILWRVSKTAVSFFGSSLAKLMDKDAPVVLCAPYFYFQAAILMSALRGTWPLWLVVCPHGGSAGAAPFLSGFP